ncbi:Aconitate hydratase 1 [compost metagenome]
MGVLPLQFHEGMSRKTLNLLGNEKIEIRGIDQNLKPLSDVEMIITRDNGKSESYKVRLRIDTAVEVDYYKNGGILQYVMRKLAAN